MSPKDVQDVLDVRPFEPLTFYTGDGRSVTITDPDKVLVAGSFVAVGLDPDADGIPTRSRMLNVRGIMQIVPADLEDQAGRN
jgi:hypothetical protein